jgi:hypothetical protein
VARELKNAKISFVSYVDKAANQTEFFFTKSAEPPSFEKKVRLFTKSQQDEQKLVYGIVYEPDVPQKKLKKRRMAFLQTRGRLISITALKAAQAWSLNPMWRPMILSSEQNGLQRARGCL